MDFRRGLRAGVGLFVGAAAMLGAACTWASPVVVKPLSATGGSPSAVQMLVTNLLGGGITVVPGSVQYTGATAASGIFVNGGTNLETSVGVNNGVVLTTGDARFVSGSATSAEDFPNKTTAFGAGILNTLTRNTSPGSPLFASLTSAPTFNASILSFRIHSHRKPDHLEVRFRFRGIWRCGEHRISARRVRRFRQWRQLRARARWQRSRSPPPASIAAARSAAPRTA